MQNSAQELMYLPTCTLSNCVNLSTSIRSLLLRARCSIQSRIAPILLDVPLARM